MKSILTVFCCFLLAFTLSAQTSILHEPALSPDGSQIAFSYQGDIWSVSVTGGAANRLTVHESYESDPIWSPDGRNIAFVGNRFGNNDIFLTTTAAGTPQRLTEHSASDYSPRWMGNDAVFFSTNRIFAQVERNAETYQAKLNGGTPVRVMDAVGNEATPSPDGRYVAFVRGSCRVTREAYRGPANRDIWVYDKQVKTYTQITTDEGQDYHPLWTKDGKLTFLSARDGRYNLYQTSPTAGASKTQLTKFKDWGIRSYSTSADGQTIAIEQGAAILVSKNGGKKFNEVNISVGRDFKFYPVEERTLTVGISHFDISPNGKYLSMVARGEVFVKPNDKDKTRSRNVSNHPYNEESSAWLNDSLLLFISDRANNKPSLLLCKSQEFEPANLYQSFQFDNTEVLNLPEGVSGFELSPQRDKIAVVEGRGNLYVYDIDSTGRLSNQTTMIDGWDNPGGLAWSPDGKWLAYSLSDLNFNQEVYIHAADNSSKPVNISMHPRGDRSPVWSPDGSKLGFVSIRNNGNNDIWFVWLREDDYEKTQRDWEEADEWETEEQEKKKKGKKGEVEPIVIDFEDIHERLVQVTSLPGNEGSPVIGPKGEMFYFTTNNGSRAGREGSSDLMMIKWDGTEMKPLLSNVRVGGLQLGPGNKKLYMNLRGKVAATPLDKGRAESQSFQAKMTLDHVAERTQMLEDGWRALNAGFYDPNFHGQDFAQLKEKYRPLMLGASTRQDFATLYNEMLGQLNASHMGFSSGTMDEDLQRDRTGMLGLEFDENQRISFILADGPADRKDSKLQIGDRITAINGAPVGASDNIYSHLNGRANERIQLTIDRNGATQKVLIRPVSSTSTLDYEAWVTLQKNLTERYSNGRLGYIHIRGMNWPSFERFERELTAAGLGKEGIVIDVRFNGGGWTTDMLMAVLNVRQHAYTVPRGAAKSLKENKKFLGNYPYGERLPLAAMTLPSVALCNETSYSNAEIFGHAYKHLGHGTLVGQPTFGAVISTGSHRLIDGSRVRMPFRAWYVHATQENMEGGPAVPDVLVKSPPGEKANNEDAQLKKAVEVLLGQIK
jgi:Tol biopolymer transport system component/C-terminal processing protease CtpA/Prc